MKNVIKSSFTKIRVKKKKLPIELEKLFHEKESIKTKIAEKENLEEYEDVVKLSDELDNVSAEIAKHCSERNKALVDEYLGRSNDIYEGFSQAKTWTLRKKLSPKNSVDPPAAKKDNQGNLVTDREELENLYMETYRDRLKPNTLAEGLEETNV